MQVTDSRAWLSILVARAAAEAWAESRPAELEWRFLVPTTSELEDLLRRRLDAFAPARTELLHVLMLPDFDRAARVGEFWASPATQKTRGRSNE